MISKDLEYLLDQIENARAKAQTPQESYALKPIERIVEKLIQANAGTLLGSDKQLEEGEVGSELSGFRKLLIEYKDYKLTLGKHQALHNSVVSKILDSVQEQPDVFSLIFWLLWHLELSRIQRDQAYKNLISNELDVARSNYDYKGDLGEEGKPL